MISACLLGIRCRYDGRHSICEGLLGFLASHPFIPFCPEQLGGLPTPRPPANMVGGAGHQILSGGAKVMNDQGKDVTRAFRKGAEEAVRVARLTKAFTAIMKDKSPSCGLHTAYCDGPPGLGMGVTAALFESHGIKMFELGSKDPFPTRKFLEFMEEPMSRHPCARPR